LAFVTLAPAWANDTKIADIAFSGWTPQTVAAGSTVNGIYFKDETTISVANGCTFNNNASTSQGYIAIPLTNVNGRLTVTCYFADKKKHQMKYGVRSGTSAVSVTQGPPSMSSTFKEGGNVYDHKFNINVNASHSYAVLYIGRASADSKNLKRIIVETPSAVYLKPGVWQTSDARFAVYCFQGSSPTDKWYDMTAVTDPCGETIYKANVDPQFGKLIFCRMKKSNSTNNWDNRWNQTNDLLAENGVFCTITGWGSGYTSTCTFSPSPFSCCITSGTWLRFTGETITINAGSTGATQYQWYKNGTADGNKIAGATSATYTKENCTLDDAGTYYCKARTFDGYEVTSAGYDVKIPRLIVQTPGAGSDRVDIPLTRASESATTATCSTHLGVQWGYEYCVWDGLSAYYGNTGTMDRSNCTNWSMNSTTWCRLQTEKEGTYTFNINFSNASLTPITASVVFPSYVQTGGVPVYFDNSNGWSAVWYRIGKGIGADGDGQNWTNDKHMTAVPGTARLYETTTISPEWNAFWAWHIGNNQGNKDGNYSIYNTQSTSYPITKSINFEGDPIPSGGITILPYSSENPSSDWKNNNCVFSGYEKKPGLYAHNVSIGATTNGIIQVHWVNTSDAVESSDAATERTINGLAHTCILTISAQPDCGYKIKTLKVNGANFTSGSTFILEDDATVSATFELDTYSITYHPNGGTINSSYATSYQHGTAVTLPTDVTKPGSQEFGGWYNNSSFSGAPVSQIADTECEDKEFWAKWGTPCELMPTLNNVTPLATIWDQKAVDMGLIKLSYPFDTTGINYTLTGVSPADPINGCHFELFDDYIHIMGTPNINNASTITVTVTFTISNDCDPVQTATISQDIRIYPKDQKARIAFIVTGTKGGAFNAYKSSDRSACSSLTSYLESYYTINFVNGYATKNTAEIEDYYKDYDLMVVTDFLDTGEGYTNALGSMIDKKPMLSFEAYVAGLSNWHISSSPKDPNPAVKKMKVLCAGHAIFKDEPPITVINADTTVDVLSTTSGKGLQGFVINEAPDFLFLATVRDNANSRDLIVCCERQIVFPARLMLYGINYAEMGNLTNQGKLVMRQMIDYLLMTDETQIADCSLVFDNNDGDHLWSNPKNWYPGYNIIPTPFHSTLIKAECWVNIDDAHAGSVKINKSRPGQPLINGKLIVKPYGGLTVAGVVTKVNDTRYATPLQIKAEDLLIEADAENNGAFIYGNTESDVRATVEYYSRGENAKTANPVWQYMGIPFQASKTAIDMYHAAWMCRWAASSGLGGLWQWVQNEDILQPFEGYCITQEAKKTYTFDGKLNAPISKTLSLDIRDEEGYAFAANSWTAPIKIASMQDADFVNAEKSIYIYHTGTYAEWNSHKSDIINPKTSTSAVLPGQYAAVPIHSSPYIGVDSVIPAMQGFFIKTTAAGASLTLDYNRVVFDATYYKTSTQPMRAPMRDSQNNKPEVMQLIVSGASFGDRIFILERPDFSDEFEDGWDGRKLEGDLTAPQLAVVKQNTEMSVAALPTANEHFLTFRAGQDQHYTFYFQYEGDVTYLYDLQTKEATQIRTGNTYSFEATNDTPEYRFLITANPPQNTPTGLESSVEIGTKPQKVIYQDQLLILYNGAIYDARGNRAESRKEGAQ
jgi:hypothetical protein